MARKIIVGILLSSLLLTAGCSLIVKTAFGINEIKEYRDTEVQSFLVESQRKVSCRQIVASIGQQDSLIRLDLDSTMMQHRGQPVQILYFDGDSLLFYHINCYTQSGLFQFNWNNYHSFDHFPLAVLSHDLALDRYEHLRNLILQMEPLYLFLEIFSGLLFLASSCPEDIPFLVTHR